MTVRAGEPWGRSGEPKDTDAVARTDVELARASTVAAERQCVQLLGGDLWRTVGGRSNQLLPVDVLNVSIDGRPPIVATAHVIARDRWARHWVAMLNAQWWRGYDLGPRSHPNDGLVDVTWGRLPWTGLAKVARRARTGAHLPHPWLHTERTRQRRFDLDRGFTVWADGVRIGRARRSLEVWVLPDAIEIAPR